jgi:hypothetical protein
MKSGITPYMEKQLDRCRCGHFRELHYGGFYGRCRATGLYTDGPESMEIHCPCVDFLKEAKGDV